MKTGRTHWVRHAWLAVAGALVVVGCGDDYHFVPDEPVDAGMDAPDEGGPPIDLPPSTPTACTVDDDCAELSTTQLCDSQGGYCVECDGAREAELDRCGNGTFCSSEGRCVLGCQADADCPGLTCDLERGLCINCVSDSNCAPGTTCVDAVCTPGCATSDTCPTSWLCCDGSCQNPETDPNGCGTCGKVCDPAGACWNGVCGEGPCELGTAECDGDPSNGCETQTQNDASNCGKCDLACASNFCAGGRCTTQECASGTADCNGEENDHCETDLTSVTDCTMCDAKCSDVHGKPACGKEGCTISCDDGYEDCDEKVGTGCEIDLTTDEENCGECGTECTNENGTTKCEDGECAPRCGDGFADCDGDPRNGCETDTNSALADCGGCGQKCNPENATGTCRDGVCRAKCEDGFADCDGNKANGCEADFSSPATCGSCDNACSDNGGKASCNAEDGTCSIKCSVGRADCVNGLADGCETDTTASASNCNGCGNVCTSTVGTPACSDSVCGVSDCTPPLETCPGAGKCGTNLSNDDENCGDCGHTCAFPSASGKCVNRLCELDACDDNRRDCNDVASDGCEVALGTTDNCRSCGESCTNAHGENECTATGCKPTCSPGFGDCDGNKNNGCETQLNSLTNCGACGTACSKAHGTPKCDTGSCQIASCSTGWDDCSSNEGTAKDGCETQLNGNGNCGGCGVACSLANGTASCGTGQCLLTGCNSGYADCSSQAGCETQLGTGSNCSACGDVCSNSHGTSSCDSATRVCKPVCSTGWKSCDGNTGNGCETQLNSATNCGDCGVPCTNPANATATCGTGACVVSCNGGFLDCTSAAGCETPRGTSSNCRTCGESCSNAHGASGCNTTTGCTFSCSADWDNCDSNANNGCETSLTTLTNCAACGTACSIPNSSESCSTGSCLPTSCNAGFDDCDSDGSCETQLNSVSDCGTCDRVCTAQNGTTSCAGSPLACTPVCNTGFRSCDNNPDNGCERSVTTLTDCGNCNTTCAFPNAAAACTVAGTTISCNMGACSSGFADCTAAAGCETTLGSTTNCTGCGLGCTNAHGGNLCVGSPGSFACQPSCDAGYGSCDSNAANGCEAPLNTNTNCGGCGSPCAMPNGTASCTTGSCTLTGCSAGYANCNTGAGCETPLGTDSNCADCGRACVNLNSSTNHCGGSPGSYVCSPACNAGFKSCDSNPDNGCERNIYTVTDCGDCNVPCTRTNATATCGAGTCGLGSCNAGFGNCDGNAANGCETSIWSNTNCSTCGDACTNSHGSNSCSPTTHLCAPTCDGGWGNCDLNPSNGCEAALNTASACGACGNVCSGATPNCVSSNGTFRCQSAIAYVNTATAQTGNGNTINASHTLLGAVTDNRLVIVGVIAGTLGTPNPGVNAGQPDTITYAGVPMTFYDRLDGLSGPADSDTYRESHLYFYYLTDTGTNKLPTTGANPRPVAVNAATAPSPNFIVAAVSQFNGVHQTAPILAKASGIWRNGGVDPSTAVPISLSGSFLFGIATGYYVGTATPIGFTQTMNVTPGDEGSSRPLAGYAGPYTYSAAGPTMGWNYSFSQKTFQFIAVLQPLHVP